MSASLSQASIPVFKVGLHVLSELLGKAESFAADKKIDSAVLLNWRLAPDMFPLIRQIQIATDLAKNGSARLAGVEPPKFEDTETNIEQLKARLTKTIAFLDGLDAKSIDGADGRNIVFPLGPSKKGQMRGAEYLHHFVVPNFHFHVSIAYAILRRCGVTIGKLDYLGQIPLQEI